MVKQVVPAGGSRNGNCIYVRENYRRYSGLGERGREFRQPASLSKKGSKLVVNNM